MRGIILAGGLGTRLYPATKLINKHALLVYDRPMIYYPLATLLACGIDEVLLVTGGPHAGDFLQLLGDGKDFGLHRLAYAVQRGEGGIADALRLGRDFADGGPVMVILGDNIFENASEIKAGLGAYRQNPGGAHLFLKQVPDPERFGVACFDYTGRIREVIEKPAQPPTNWAVTGCYIYDNRVFKICENLVPSSRGELEITDVNNYYIKRGELAHSELCGEWTDAGSFASLLRAATLAATWGNH